MFSFKTESEKGWKMRLKQLNWNDVELWEVLPLQISEILEKLMLSMIMFVNLFFNVETLGRQHFLPVLTSDVNNETGENSKAISYLIHFSLVKNIKFN